MSNAKVKIVRNFECKNNNDKLKIKEIINDRNVAIEAGAREDKDEAKAKTEVADKNKVNTMDESGTERINISNECKDFEREFSGNKRKFFNRLSYDDGKSIEFEPAEVAVCGDLYLRDKDDVPSNMLRNDGGESRAARSNVLSMRIPRSIRKRLMLLLNLPLTMSRI